MRTLRGTIVSAKMQKTVVVRVDRLKKLSKYQKYVRTSRTFKAHDERGEYRLGDVVMIREAPPMSREKRWSVTGLVKRAESASEELESASDQENKT
ncbi:MAG: 30S ribosomal protein S17 [Candidatus Sungbacteria bacterium]|nr:30S ribosomal protein S17 [Candidatus Sungbacteria bacterium]